MTTAAKKLVRATPEEPGLYRLSVEQYHRMVKAGVLVEGEKVELLEGLLVKKMTINPPHRFVVLEITALFPPLLPQEWILMPGGPITLADSEPEPDQLIVVGPRTRYRSCHPVPADIGLVIEVSDSTLSEDRTTKQRIYARARLPEYWIVNIPERQIEVYTRPRAGASPRYQQRQDYTQTQAVPLVLRGQAIASIAVADLLPASTAQEE